MTAFYNHDAEAAVLAALTTGRRDAAQYATQLTADDFHSADHRAIFQAIQQLIAANRDITLVTLSDTLTREAGNDNALVSALPGIQAHSVVGWAISSHIDLIKAASLRRDLYARLDAAKQQLMDADNDSAAVLESTRQSLRDLVITGHSWQEMPDVLLNTYEALERRQKGEEKSMPSGISILDKMTSGFHRGELTIIGARPAVGKSALGMHIALATAAQGYRVGVVSREMTDVQYGARILGSRTDIEPGRLRTGQLDPCDWAQLSEAMEHYSGMNISFMFSTRDVEDLRMEVQKKVDSEGLDMLLIDYLQLLQTRRKFEKDYLRVGYISKAIKDMTTDFNIPIIALAQVGRSSAHTMPGLSEFRGSGDIEQDADNVIFMHRPEDPGDDSILPGDRDMLQALEDQGKQYILLEIAKQRQGETGRTAVVFDPAHMQYTSIVRE